MGIYWTMWKDNSWYSYFLYNIFTIKNNCIFKNIFHDNIRKIEKKIVKNVEEGVKKRLEMRFSICWQTIIFTLKLQKFYNTFKCPK